MAREVRIVFYCDNEKKHKGADVPADALPPIALGGKQPRELDLCAECRVELFEPLKALLDNEGRAPEKPRTETASQVTCPHCGRKLASARGLGIHLARSHPEVSATADSPSAVGEFVCRQCAHEPFGTEHGLKTHISIKHPFTCPTCERSFKTPNALGAHRNRAHGYRAGDDEQ